MWVRPTNSSAYLHLYTPSAFPAISFCNQDRIKFVHNDVSDFATLTSTGMLGLGAAPAYQLDVRAANNNGAQNVMRLYQYNAAQNDYHAYQVAIDPTNNWVYHYSAGTNNGGHAWGGSSSKMSLDADGNLANDGYHTARGNIASIGNGNGQVQLTHSGNTGNTGYVSFINYLGVRQGYIGFAATGGSIAYVNENGTGHAFTGPITCTSTITASSDRKLKSEIIDLEPEEELKNIKKLSPKSYIKDGKLDFGVIAQDLQHGSMDRLVSEIDDEGTLGVNYMGMIAPMIAAMQAMADRIEVLETRLAMGV